jgi:hypothetical protein
MNSRPEVPVVKATSPWPRCDWNIAKDEPREPGATVQMGDCMNMVSRSFGTRRPYFRACETCSTLSRRLRRFMKSERRVESYSYHVYDLGVLTEIRELPRPEAAIIAECKAGNFGYRPGYGWEEQ